MLCTSEDTATATRNAWRRDTQSEGLPQRGSNCPGERTRPAKPTGLILARLSASSPPTVTDAVMKLHRQPGAPQAQSQTGFDPEGDSTWNDHEPGALETNQGPQSDA